MDETLSYKEEISELDLLSSNYPYTKRKILILGGQEVGKTAIIKRYKNNIFLEDYESTIQQITKKIYDFNDEIIFLEIMDFEGQTEYTIFSPNKFSFGYNGYILVYDVTSSKSFDLIKFIYEQINVLSGDISKILVGTKCDKDLDSNSNYPRQVSTEQGKQFAEKINCPFLEVSSKDNINIEEIFRLLIIEINKTESGIDLTQIKFIKIFSFFVHHPKLMIICFYINSLILIIVSIFSFYLGIYKDVCLDKEDKDYYYFGVGFPYILFGIWGILINVGGIVGIKTKEIDLLKLYCLGLIYTGFFSLISIGNITSINFFQEITTKKIINNIVLFIIVLVPLIIGILLSSIYKNLFQKNLKLYMA